MIRDFVVLDKSRMAPILNYKSLGAKLSVCDQPAPPSGAVR